MPKDKSLTFALSLALLVAAWWALSVLRGDPNVLPAPPEVMRIMAHEAASGDLWRHMAATLRRVALGFTLAMGLGTALGIALGSMPRLNALAWPWVVFFLNLPALVVIVLCYLWIGLNETAAIVAVALNKTAMVLVTIREGVETRDPAIADMGRVYRLSAWTRLRHILLPQLAPYFAASARNGLAIIWKIVLVVEFLGRSSGVGFQIHLYFQLFEIGHVLAYALSFVVVMLAIEFLILAPWQAAASGWRRSASA